MLLKILKQGEFNEIVVKVMAIPLKKDRVSQLKMFPDIRGLSMSIVDKDEDQLAPIEAQCEWLREIGFKDVDCFFKHFEIGLFGGRKK